MFCNGMASLWSVLCLFLKCPLKELSLKSLILADFSVQGQEKGANNTLSPLSSVSLLLKVEIWIYKDEILSA